MYILILTLAVKISYAGMGGIAMQEFETYETCNEAASKWEQTVKARGRIDSDEISALCVKK